MRWFDSLRRRSAKSSSPTAGTSSHGPMKLGVSPRALGVLSSALDDLFAGMPMRETESAMFRPPASTWADPKRAGGFGWGQLVHPLGLLFRILDLEPREVFAVTGPSPTGVDYYDAAVVRFAGGAAASLSGAATFAEGQAGAGRPPRFRIGGNAAARHRTRALGTPPARRQ